MTASTESLHFEIYSRRDRPRPQWRRAVRALRELVRYPDRTYLAFDIAEFLDPEMSERRLLRMLSHPEGRRVYDERPSLRACLTDRAALEAMDDGSFGRAYLDHLDRYGLDADKLAELGQRPDALIPDSAVAWMRERGVMTHDLWHVLTGYGADQFGESALLCFSLAQTGGRSNLLLSFGANARGARERGLRWIRYAWTAWRRGRAAVCLAALPYEELLHLPLADVRAAAGIEPPDEAHPSGVVRGDPIRSTDSDT
jgi:ubiquinone biosynthesis protein COQ4